VDAISLDGPVGQDAFLAALAAAWHALLELRDKYNWCDDCWVVAEQLSPAFTRQVARNGEEGVLDLDKAKYAVLPDNVSDLMSPEGMIAFGQLQGEHNRQALTRLCKRLLYLVSSEQALTLEEVNGVFRSAGLPEYASSRADPLYSISFPATTMRIRAGRRDDGSLLRAFRTFLASLPEGITVDTEEMKKANSIVAVRVHGHDDYPEIPDRYTDPVDY
jgi:hypothetical protein